MKYLPLLIFVFCNSVQAKDKAYIFDMYERFTLTSALAGKCLKPEDDELTSFLSNYQMVTTYALQEIRKRKPKMTKDQAMILLKKNGTKITTAANNLITIQGCESEAVKESIKFFHVLAKWKPAS